MIDKLSCKICNSSVAANNRAIYCDNCKISGHIKCNKINGQTFNTLQNDKITCYCMNCSETLFPSYNNKPILTNV